MPATKKKSGFAAKHGARVKKAHAKHKGDAKKVGNMELPGGIENGTAQLKTCKLGVYEKGPNKGEYFFRADGIIVHPAEFDGMEILGQRTQIGPEPLCDTPKSTGKKTTLEDHYAWTLNELRKLGIDTREVGEDNLENVCAALEKAQPHFLFRTWKGDKQTTGPYKGKEPRTNHDWLGVCSWNGDLAEGVDDDTEEKPAKKQKRTRSAAKEETAAAAADDDAPFDADDLSGLAEAADNDDEQAQMALVGQCKMCNLDYESYESWADCAEAIAAADASDGEAVDAAGDNEIVALGKIADGDESDESNDAIDKLVEMAEAANLDANEYDSWESFAVDLAEAPAEDEPIKPENGQTFLFKPPRKRKAVECEVTAVFVSKESCNLKNLDDGKSMYKGVKWEKLLPIE